MVYNKIKEVLFFFLFFSVKFSYRNDLKILAVEYTYYEWLLFTINVE